MQAEGLTSEEEPRPPRPASQFSRERLAFPGHCGKVFATVMFPKIMIAHATSAKLAAT